MSRHGLWRGAFFAMQPEQRRHQCFLLQRLDLPFFHLLFQLMIFAALLESGTGAVNAINERVSAAYRVRRKRVLPNAGRLAVASVLLIGSMFIADHFGLVALIAMGYRALAWIFLAVYVLPLMTWGMWLLWRGSVHPATAPPTGTAMPASGNLPER